MSCTRSSNAIILRKQKSLITEASCPTAITSRERRFRLQKQFSIDHSQATRDLVGASLAAHRHIVNGQQHVILKKSNNNNNKNSSWNINGDIATSPEASLRIFTAFKNKSSATDECGAASASDETLKRQENVVAKNPLSKRTEEKININIFLAHNVELDQASDAETNANEAHLFKAKNTHDINPSVTKAKNASNAAESRRNQFRNQKTVSICEGRHPPRLMRAMSAPIRQNPPSPPNMKSTAESTILNEKTAAKKRLRRKKIAPIEIEPFNFQMVQQRQPEHQQLYQRKFYLEKSFDERPSTAKGLNIRPKPKLPRPITAQPRTRSIVSGCDAIVTLVSLLSPGGSDSEKEDHSIDTAESTNEKQMKPSLRKSGKSVSFQENEENSDFDPILEFPSVLRRSSLAPLATKIRLNRPPTAPAGSIFLRPNTLSDNAMNPEKGTTNQLDSDESEGIVPPINDKPLTDINRTSGASVYTASSRKPSIDASDTMIVYPEYVRSIKEKECWLLFQKMINKGISVSYETIMRGMLTPTEVRAVERKQKEICERQASLDLDAAASAAECDTKK